MPPHLLPDREAIYREWRRLVVAHAVSGVQVHDARLAAAMLVHGITHLLTLNSADFVRFPGITAVRPSEIAKLRHLEWPSECFHARWALPWNKEPR